MQSEENVINTWNVSYSNSDGDKYNGKLTITNKRLLYDAYDYKKKQNPDKTSLFAKWASEYYIVILKERIRSVNIEKGIFSKRVTVTLDDKSKHIFNNRILNIDSIAEAINFK